MPRSTIHVDTTAAGHGEEIPVEANFDIPVKNKHQGMAITGIILFIIGLAALIIMGIFMVLGYPEDWFSTWGGDLDRLQTLKERVGVLGLVGAAFLFNGLSFYTYGRTYSGAEEMDVYAGES